MENLEHKALTTFAHPPEIWLRYVDDTFSKVKNAHIDNFLAHLNAQHPRIKFTMEVETDGRIAFLDTLIHRKPDNTTKITIYRKATHTDQYLDWTSNHHLTQKTGIIQTFKRRAQKLVTDETDRETEIQHTKHALKFCGHPQWSLDRPLRPARPASEKQRPVAKVSIPYTKGLSERISRTMKKYNITTIHKPTATIKNILCASLKDKVHKLDKANTIYRFDCQKCNKSYVGETERSLRARAHEHGLLTHQEAKTSHSLKPSSTDSPATPTRIPVPTTTRSTRSTRNRPRPDYAAMHTGSNITWTEGNTEISKHLASTPHSKTDYTFDILTTEPTWRKRIVKEAIEIKQIPQDQLLNENMGKHNIQPIYSPLIRKLTTTDTNGQQRTHKTRPRPSASNHQTNAGVTHQPRRSINFSGQSQNLPILAAHEQMQQNETLESTVTTPSALDTAFLQPQNFRNRKCRNNSDEPAVQEIDKEQEVPARNMSSN